ncbi:MAG TPA: hypothetical protein VLJ79_12860, partial [Candidatus Binatia bacterium]|nr:hypothetical protein [Candidatus Binatia bacterium]
SNPEKRKLYNHNLEQDEIKTHSRPESIFSRPPSRPEALVPQAMSLLHKPPAFFPREIDMIGVV